MCLFNFMQLSPFVFSLLSVFFLSFLIRFFISHFEGYRYIEIFAWTKGLVLYAVCIYKLD